MRNASSALSYHSIPASTDLRRFPPPKPPLPPRRVACKRAIMRAVAAASCMQLVAMCGAERSMWPARRLYLLIVVFWGGGDGVGVVRLSVLGCVIVCVCVNVPHDGQGEDEGKRGTETPIKKQSQPTNKTHRSNARAKRFTARSKSAFPLPLPPAPAPPSCPACPSSLLSLAWLPCSTRQV